MPGVKEDCVGCGYCCSHRICRLGAMIYGHYTHPCPALQKQGAHYRCNLYLSDPLRHGDILEIGQGCCMPGNPWRRNSFAFDDYYE